MTTRRRVAEVHIDGLALLKLVKHCGDSLPKMVAGSLLGLDQGAVLEVTHCFPFLAPQLQEDIESLGDPDDVDGAKYQMEMMKMLREVNVDNNCVGWYKSIYAGSFCQTPLVETQFNYQENLSNNSVVMLYDPTQTDREGLKVKAYQLSEQFTTEFRTKSNSFVPPCSILVELPLKVRNPGLIAAFLCDLRGPRRLGLSLYGTDRKAASFECHLEHCCQWLDDLIEEQGKFQYYLRNGNKDHNQRLHHKQKGDIEAETWKNTTQPLRLDSLLIANQIEQYCTQINTSATCILSKLRIGASFRNTYGGRITQAGEVGNV